MTSDLSDFGDTINALRHAHDDPLLSKKIFTHAPSAKKNERFLIKMEIRRLAQPIQRVIDLRDIFGSRCVAETKQNIRHYLDPVASEVFDQELARYKGVYCRGVYEFVLHEARQRARREETPELRAPAELHFNQVFQRKEERVYLASKLKIAFVGAQDGAPETSCAATTTDLSPRGAAIKVPLKDFRATTHVDVCFEALQQEYAVKPPIFLRYKRLRSKKVGSHMYLFVLLEEGNQPGLEQIQPLIVQSLRLNKKRNRVALENTEEAVWVKMHEQHFAANVGSLPVFVEHSEQGTFARTCIFDKTHNNLLPFFVLQGQPILLSTLFEHPEVAPPAAGMRGSQLLFVLRMRTREGNVVLAALPAEAAFTKRKYAQWVEQAQDGMRCLQLDWVTTDSAEHCHLPTSLPDEAGEVFASLNQPPSSKLKHAMGKMTHLCVIHDLTGKMTELGLREALARAEDEDAVTDPRVRPDPAAKMFVSVPPKKERRAEHRYREQIAVSVRRHRETKQVMQAAKSLNVSTRGLALEFAKAHGFRKGDELVVDLQMPASSPGEALVKQRYVAVSVDDQVLRCAASGDLASHDARIALRDMVRDNPDRLRRDDLNEPLPGYALAVRRLYSHYHSQWIGFVASEQNQYRVCTSITGSGMLPWDLHDLLDDREARLRAATQLLFLDELKARLTQESDAPGEFYVLLVAKKIKGVDEVRLISKYVESPCEPAALGMIYRNLKSMGNVVVLQVYVQRLDDVNDADYREEQRYLARYAKTRHEQLMKNFERLKGVYIATNITPWLEAAAHESLLPKDELNLL